MSCRAFAVVALLVLAGCSSQQTSPQATTTASAAPGCRSLVAALPENLDGESLTDRSDTSATWGTSMTLTCGVAVPAAYEKTSEMFVINDISWFAEMQEGGYLFTAVGRGPLVAIFVPDNHTPEVNPLVDLAAVMAKHTKVTGPAGSAP